MIDARRAALLAWYDRSQRTLPWRATSDPYAVLVSEVMAQQTQLGRVVPYYERFMDRFPTVRDLAAAPLGDVLTAWSGLGYNRRARYLHEAAQRVAADGWPLTIAGLRQLPGVGAYTAAAIACFAFGEPRAAVDTNMRRVLSRWHGTELSGQILDEAARTELDEERAADWNQAVMDLGAAICTSHRPRCTECPVAAWCADPSIYSPPPKQAPFNGSLREARGAVLKALVDGGATTTEALMKRIDVDDSRIDHAITALQREGMINSTPRGWDLAGDR